MINATLQFAARAYNFQDLVHIEPSSVGELSEKLKAIPSTDIVTQPWDDAFFNKSLVRSSINYCYWYGRHDLRPGEACATDMYKIVDKAFDEKGPCIHEGLVEAIIRESAYRRYPMHEHRSRHLRELLDANKVAELNHAAYLVYSGQSDIIRVFRTLVGFPGFAGDIFLKRAFLFLMDMFRFKGWFADSIGDVPVPADYQIPKMLRHFGVLKYCPDLAFKVDNNILLPEGSNEEVSILAATINACQAIADLAGRKPVDVDYFLWMNRKSCTDPFHLTITTNY